MLNNVFIQNLYWADSGDLVAIASDTSFYMLKFNVRILNSSFNVCKGVGHFLLYTLTFYPEKCSILLTFVLLLQRDVVSAHLDSGRSADEEGVEDAFELLYEINERVRTGVWVGDCFIYNNSSWRLNYCVGGEVLYNLNMFR